VKHNIGRAAARRNASKQPRAIRVGPNGGGKKIGTLHTGISSDFFSLNSGGLSRDGGTVNKGGLSDFASIPGVYL